MEWISVKERMPEAHVWVIVYGHFGINPHVDWAVFDGKHWKYGEHLGQRFKEVTHWMPLPSGPKE